MLQPPDDVDDIPSPPASASPAPCDEVAAPPPLALAPLLVLFPLAVPEFDSPVEAAPAAEELSLVPLDCPEDSDALDVLLLPVVAASPARMLMVAQ